MSLMLFDFLRKTDMRTMARFLAALLLVSLYGCAVASTKGPGMTLTYGNGKLGTLILVDQARTSDGGEFPTPGGLGPDKHPLRGGKTMGAAPDNRPVPQWVEFTWKEFPYPSNADDLPLGPVQHARISVSDRVPADVVAEVIRSKQTAKTRDETLRLWLNFVWQRDGIAFGWQQYRGCCTLLRSGGDHVD